MGCDSLAKAMVAIDASKMNKIEDQAANMNPGVDKHLRDQTADPLDEWSATVMRNMKCMATDEAYRLSIAKYLS